MVDRWDEEEREPFDGMAQRDDPKDCTHYWDVQTSKCCVCGKTREQLRKEWS